MSISHSIIVVDDEPELASIFKAFLKNEGYNVIAFTDPALALEHYKETWDKYSLLITDLRMPSISGIDLAKKVREIDSEIKIFLMTAFETKDLEENKDFRNARIDQLIQKPIRFSDFRVMINNALKNFADSYFYCNGVMIQ